VIYLIDEILKELEKNNMVLEKCFTIKKRDNSYILASDRVYLVERKITPYFKEMIKFVMTGTVPEHLKKILGDKDIIVYNNMILTGPVRKRDCTKKFGNTEILWDYVDSVWRVNKDAIVTEMYNDFYTVNWVIDSVEYIIPLVNNVDNIIKSVKDYNLISAMKSAIPWDGDVELIRRPNGDMFYKYGDLKRYFFAPVKLKRNYIIFEAVPYRDGIYSINVPWDYEKNPFKYDSPPEEIVRKEHMYLPLFWNKRIIFEWKNNKEFSVTLDNSTIEYDGESFNILIGDNVIHADYSEALAILLGAKKIGGIGAMISLL